MALLGAFQALLSMYAGQLEFGAGSPMACRELDGIGSLIGCFSNTVVLRADFTGDPTFLDTLARVREVVLAALSHQRMPFDKLVEAVNPPRDPSRNALVQVNFRLLSTAMPRSAGELTFEYLELDNRRCKFDLAFELAESANGLGGYVEYSTDLFRSESIARMVEDYEDLLRAMAAQPNVPINELELRLRFGRRNPPALQNVKRKPADL